jgi:hypothetical protein
MSIFIKDFCSDCPPTVCEAPQFCPTRFLVPESDPQDGKIIVNRFIINLSGLEFCPCLNPDNPSLPCDTYQQEAWDYFANQIYSNLSNPIVLEYGAYSGSYEFPTYDFVSGFPYFCITGTLYGIPPNQPFSVFPIVGADGYPCYGPEFFKGTCATSDTETSITVNNDMTLEECASYGPFYPQGYGGSVTITWE